MSLFSLQDPILGQKAKEAGSQIIQLIQNEIGTSASIPFEMDNIHIPQAESDADFEFHFTLPVSRPARLSAHVHTYNSMLMKEGVIGLLTYSANLSKAVGSRVSLQQGGWFSKAKFVGDPIASEKLNADGDIAYRANDFGSTINPPRMIVKRLFELVPHASGSILVISCFRKNAKVQVKDFLDLVAMVESAL